MPGGSGRFLGFSVEAVVVETGQVIIDTVLRNEAETNIKARRVMVKRLKYNLPDIHVRTKSVEVLCTEPQPPTLW